MWIVIYMDSDPIGLPFSGNPPTWTALIQEAEQAEKSDQTE